MKRKNINIKYNAAHMRSKISFKFNKIMSRMDRFFVLRGTIIQVLIIYVFSLVLMFLWGFRDQQRRSMNEEFHIFISLARGFGYTLNLSCSLVLLLACRVMFTKMRETCLNVFIPFDKTFPSFHIVVGYFIVICSFLHGIFHMIWVTKWNQWGNGIFGITMSMVTGYIIFSILMAMFITSVQTFRVKFFNRFYQFHSIGAFIFYFLLLFHGVFMGDPYTFKWISGPIFVYLLDRISRSFKIHTANLSLTEKNITFSGDDVMRISVNKLFKYRAGQYAEIKVPAIDKTEWHPFTISSAPEEGNIVFYIRCCGDWTGKLKRTAEKITSSGVRESIEINIRGPFGAPAQHFDGYDRLILISGGVGATTFVSVCKQIYFQRQKMKEKQKGTDFSFTMDNDENHFEYIDAIQNNDLLDVIQILDEVKKKGREDENLNIDSSATSTHIPEEQSHGNGMNKASEGSESRNSKQVGKNNSVLLMKQNSVSKNPPESQNGWISRSTYDSSLIMPEKDSSHAINIIESTLSKKDDDTSYSSYKPSLSLNEGNTIHNTTNNNEIYSEENYYAHGLKSIDTIGHNLSDLKEFESSMHDSRSNRLNDFHNRTMKIEDVLTAQKLRKISQMSIEERIGMFFHSVSLNMILYILTLTRISLLGGMDLFRESNPSENMFLDGSSNYWWLTISDVTIGLVIAAIITASIIVDLIIQKEYFFKKYSNIIDLFALMSVSIASNVTGIYALDAGSSHISHSDELIHIFLILVLFSLIFWRLSRSVGSRIRLADRHRDSHFRNLVSIDFLWMTQNMNQNRWIREELKPFSDVSCLRLHHYLTRLSENEALEKCISFNENKKIFTNNGKPDWKVLFKKIAQRTPSNGRVGVFLCGPEGLASAVKEAIYDVQFRSILRGIYLGVSSEMLIKKQLEIKHFDYVNILRETGSNIQFVFRKENFG